MSVVEEQARPAPGPARSLQASFGHAWTGLLEAGRQRNLRLHLWAASLVGAVGSALGLTTTQAIASLLCVLMVLFAELINTALESLVDLHTERFHELARRAKDTAAAAVLLLSAGSVLIFGSVCLESLRQSAEPVRELWPKLATTLPAPLAVGALLQPRRASAGLAHLLLAAGATGLCASIAPARTVIFPGLTAAILIVAWRIALGRVAATHP